MNTILLPVYPINQPGSPATVNIRKVSLSVEQLNVLLRETRITSIHSIEDSGVFVVECEDFWCRRIRITNDIEWLDSY